MIRYHICMHMYTQSIMSILTRKIEEHIEPVVRDLGFGIVRVAFIGSAKTRTLQVMIERTDEEPIAIKDCENVSRAVSVALDVLDPVKGGYNLEVSSPGIDRPLVKPEDFKRFIGNYVVIKTFVLKNDRKIFKGLLDSTTESGIRLRLDTSSECECTIVDLEYGEIKYARLDGMRDL